MSTRRLSLARYTRTFFLLERYLFDYSRFYTRAREIRNFRAAESAKKPDSNNVFIEPRLSISLHLNANNRTRKLKRPLLYRKYAHARLVTLASDLDFDFEILLDFSATHTHMQSVRYALWYETRKFEFERCT